MSSHQMSLVLVQVQISSESSNRCSEQGGEIELRHHVSVHLLWENFHFQVVYTSKISLPRWREEIHNSSKGGWGEGEGKEVFPREAAFFLFFNFITTAAAFLYCLLSQLLLKFPLDRLVSVTV